MATFLDEALTFEEFSNFGSAPQTSGIRHKRKSPYSVFRYRGSQDCHPSENKNRIWE
jgi:hypothetical protein